MLSTIDLIWSSAATAIDSRENQLVKLREDILNEVTRLYFERRRAQVEFVLLPPQDVLEQMTTLLRMDELTASIDALTDGFLTSMLQEIYSTHPEFQSLWSVTQ